jgi:hypothetical protein
MSVEYVVGAAGLAVAVLSYRWNRHGRHLDWRREAYERVAAWAAIADYEVGTVSVAFVISPGGPADASVLRAILDMDLSQPPTSAVTGARLHGSRQVVGLLDDACHAVGMLEMRCQLTFPADAIDHEVLVAQSAVRAGRDYVPPDASKLRSSMTEAETALASLTTAIVDELHPRWRWWGRRPSVTGV